MNEFFKNLKNEALNIKLSQNEKQRMRVALYEAIKVPQPPALQPALRVRAVHSTYVWFSPRFVMPLATFLVVMLGTGTAYAAQGSLPGDVLYPIKIHVNEAVEVALATTPAEKATAEENIAGRRVMEAQTLDVQGRLDATTTQELEDNFNEHASRALALTGEEPVAAISSATSTETVPVQQRGGKEERQAPRAATFRVASIPQEATSSEAKASASSIHNARGDMSASFQTQRNIFNELKLRVGKHDHGGDTTDNTGNQNNNQGGDQNSNQNDNRHGDQGN